MILLKGLFFIIIVGVVLFIAITTVRLLWSARQLFNGIRGDRSQRHTDTYGNSANPNGNISDRRSPEEVSRRIISDDEGEYVEYEEIDG